MSRSRVVPRAGRAVAVLAGTQTHVHGLPDVPASACVTGLHTALTGPLGLFAPEDAAIAVDWTRDELLALVEETSRRPPADLVLCYFAGHGVLGPNKELCLALPETVDDPGHALGTALPVADLLRVLGGVQAKHRVLVLDCCFSGRAVDLVPAVDVHVLAATNRTERARFDVEADRTAFTGALLDVLTGGVPDGPEHLDLAGLYRRLVVEQAAAGLPVPSQCAVNDSGDVALVRNPAVGTALTRKGLRFRARFAQRTGMAGRRAEEERLLAEVVRDTRAALPAGDRDAVLFRHAHASAAGRAGDPAAAVALLDALLTETGPDHGVRATRDHWAAL